jgi:hypothetical protein
MLAAERTSEPTNAATRWLHRICNGAPVACCRVIHSRSLSLPHRQFLNPNHQIVMHAVLCYGVQDSELAELVGTAAHDKLVGRVQHPADAPTRVRRSCPTAAPNIAVVYVLCCAIHSCSHCCIVALLKIYSLHCVLSPSQRAVQIAILIVLRMPAAETGCGWLVLAHLCLAVVICCRCVSCLRS